MIPVNSFGRRLRLAGVRLGLRQVGIIARRIRFRVRFRVLHTWVLHSDCLGPLGTFLVLVALLALLLRRLLRIVI